MCFTLFEQIRQYFFHIRRTDVVVIDLYPLTKSCNMGRGIETGSKTTRLQNVGNLCCNASFAICASNVNLQKKVKTEQVIKLIFYTQSIYTLTYHRDMIQGLSNHLIDVHHGSETNLRRVEEANLVQLPD
jgi:hypothetical protein